MNHTIGLIIILFAVLVTLYTFRIKEDYDNNLVIIKPHDHNYNMLYEIDNDFDYYLY